ncbi:EpsG family protein [Rubrivirga sp. IMCC43871]|uniref:EpsG family protein n=1 Tax=Rubrivirga sp. IMCC43871 TaxID=3391575 RepID=UPI00398FB09B
MTPYLLVLFAVSLLAAAGRASRSLATRRLSLWLVAVILAAFAGLRERSVGLDTGNYVYEFSVATSSAHIVRSTEVGFNLLVFAARSISDSYAAILLLIAMIVVGCYMWTITRLAVRVDWAIYLLVTLGVYTFFFNGARQGLAAAICFAALPALIHRKAILYVVMVAIAATFHHSAVVALPMYVLASRRFTLNRLLLLGAAGIAAIALLQPIIQLAGDFISDRYYVYAQPGEGGGGEVFLAYLVVQGAALLVFRERVQARYAEVYLLLLNLYLVGLIPALASVFSGVNPSGLFRLHMYFSPVAILMWPMLFASAETARNKVAVNYLATALTLVFFVLTTMAFSDLVPYRVNPDLFQW